MPKNVIVEGMGKITLADNDFLTSGGQADIYVKGDNVFKIYHDATRMIPTKKIEELQLITDVNVLKPDHIIYDSKNQPIGYTMEYKKNTHPICKLFTKAFKDRNNVSNDMINDFLEKMMGTINNVHSAKCLIVDLNELNVLSSSKFKTPYFIDVDSYETPNFKADAIMESIRDRLIKNQKWNENSDWYSFAILAFQMWIGIHPYKGTHPDYAPGDWQLRMEKGISVFEKGVSLPKACNDFSVIPLPFLSWFKDLFVRNMRCPPPSFSDINNLVIPVSAPTIQHLISALFEVNRVLEIPENITSVFNFMGVNYLAGTTKLYKDTAPLPVDISGSDNVLFCESGDISPVVAIQKNDKVTFSMDSGVKLGEIMGKGMMYRNGCIYTIFNGNMTENSFSRLGGRIVHMPRYAGGVLDNATQVFDGVMFQNLLGKMHITLPYEKGKLCILHIKELDGRRLLDAACRGNICIVMTEKKGIYTRFYLTFNQLFNQYSVRQEDNVPYANINMALMQNGVCILANDANVEIFKGSSVRLIDNPPFDSNDSLYVIGGGLHFVEGNKLNTARMK